MTPNNDGKSNKKTPLNKPHPYGANLRPVSQFDLEGNLIREYRSIAEAASKNEISSSNIIACLNGKLKTTGGYIWKSNRDTRNFYKAIDQYDMTKTYVRTHKSITEAARYTGIPRSTISSNVSGYTTHAGNYIFVPSGESVENIEVVVSPKHSICIDQYTLDGKFVKTYPSLYTAARENGLHQPNITNCIKSGNRTSGGYIWVKHGEKPPKNLISNGRVVGKRAKINKVDENGNILDTYKSITECAKRTGISKQKIKKEIYSKEKIAKPISYVLAN